LASYVKKKEEKKRENTVRFQKFIFFYLFPPVLLAVLGILFTHFAVDNIPSSTLTNLKA
jgi:hypothetical protein